MTEKRAQMSQQWLNETGHYVHIYLHDSIEEAGVSKVVNAFDRD